MTSGINNQAYPQAREEPGDFLLNNDIELDCDDDLIFVTVKMYKFFLANGRDGLDAKQLFDHLLFTSRIQKSKKIMANMTYIKNGLGWGRDKTKKAKSFLAAAGLIEYSQHKDNSGQYKGQKIILKKSWNTETLLDWIERRNLSASGFGKKSVDSEGVLPSEKDEISPVLDRKSNGSEVSSPTDNEGNPGGLDSSPVEDVAPSDSETPDSGWSPSPASGSTGPPVTAHNYKGSYNNRNLPQEESPPPEATSPPPASFKDLSELKSYLISLVKKRDPESMFYFTGPEIDIMTPCFERYGPDWIIDRFNTYLKSKSSVSQINRFHADDFPRVMKRAMTKSSPQKPMSKPLEPKFHECPVCGKNWSASSTLSICPKCGLGLTDFSNLDEVEIHREWYETDMKPRLEGTA